jgi:hypothetical protein
VREVVSTYVAALVLESLMRLRRDEHVDTVVISVIRRYGATP